MYTTYHLDSAQDINSDILDAIKANFKSKPIVITVEEEVDFDISDNLKKILDERLLENESDYISSEKSIIDLKKRYGV